MTNARSQYSCILRWAWLKLKCQSRFDMKLTLCLSSSTSFLPSFCSLSPATTQQFFFNNDSNQQPPVTIAMLIPRSNKLTAVQLNDALWSDSFSDKYSQSALEGILTMNLFR